MKSSIDKLVKCNHGEIIDNAMIWLPVVVGWCVDAIDRELLAVAKEELFFQTISQISWDDALELGENTLNNKIEGVLETISKQRKRLLCKKELYRNIGKKLNEYVTSE